MFLFIFPPLPHILSNISYILFGMLISKMLLSVSRPQLGFDLSTIPFIPPSTTLSGNGLIVPFLVE